MEFCKQCGGALNLFESNDENICWSCVRQQEKQQPLPPVAKATTFDCDDLKDASFSVANTMLVLTAKEGWTLWSGPLDQPVTIDVIMKRARHIYSIRKKRQQNSN